MCDTDKFDLFFRHSITTQVLSTKTGKKAPRHLIILKTTSLLRQDFMAQKSLQRSSTVLEVSLFTGQRKYCMNATGVKLRHFCKEDYHAIVTSGLTPQLLRYTI